MSEKVKVQYRKWLNKKGLTEFDQIFPSNLELWLDLIYRYMHDDLVLLKSVPHEYSEEFFFDFLLRKLVAEPHEYVLYPPALKFFYKFLREKGYIAESVSEDIIETIDKIEPQFIDLLRERFG
jgi:hypothetical protein